MHIVVLRLGKAFAERLVERLALRTRHIGQPVGHGHHLANARITHGGGRAQGVAVEGVEAAFVAHLAGGFHQQGQVIAPVAGDHRLRAAALDLDGVRRKVFDAAHRVQLVAHHRHVGALRGQLLLGLAQHGLAKAVVLANQVHALEGFVLAHHLHQRGHAHVGVGVKAEVPEAALFVGEDRVHRRVVQEQHAFAGFTLVVLVDGFDQHRSRGRRIALQDDLRAVINCCAQGRQGFFVLALAVVAFQHQRALAASRSGQGHTTARIHTFHGPVHVAKHRLACVGKGA